jgi:hypothetical protein
MTSGYSSPIIIKFPSIPGKNLARKCECESESEKKKSEALALATALTLFVVPSGLEPELF